MPALTNFPVNLSLFFVHAQNPFLFCSHASVCLPLLSPSVVSFHLLSTYCPPELPAGAFLATQVDLFAAGVILYTMLVGVLPFRRSHFNFADGGANYAMICSGRLIELARSQCQNRACVRCHSRNVADGSCRVSPAAASMLQRLLARSPQDRLTMAALLQTVYMTTDELETNPEDEVWPADEE